MVAADSEWYRASAIYLSRVPWLASSQSEMQPPAARWEFRQALSVGEGREKKLLDVGCGHGECLYLAQQAGYNVTGLDFNPMSLEFVRRVFGISQVYDCSIRELSVRFPDERFDVVTMFEVLEHTADPFETVCAVRALLRSGGFLCLSVPSYERWPPLFDPEVDSPPHHLTLWTEMALRRILERAGLQVLTIRRKPLESGDLGIHLKWWLQRVWRGVAGQRCAVDPSAASPVQTGSIGITARQLIRRFGMLSLAPMSYLLRLNPKAGGFTLFVRAQKA